MLDTLDEIISDTRYSIANQLTRDTLMQLANREIGLIHVKGFYNNPHAKAVAQAMINHPNLGHYSKKYTSSVGRVFTPHIDAEWDDEARAIYAAESSKNIQSLRELFLPNCPPIDYVRCRLQELWPKGANIQELYGQKCFVGTCRVFKPAISTFYPHHDRIDEETDAQEILDLTEQLVANVYLETPPTGGELELWLREPDDQERERIRHVEGLLRDTVEPPKLVIKPEAGDLTMFSTRLLHAVRPSPDGYRIGMAAFIGVHGINKPLTYWS